MILALLLSQVAVPTLAPIGGTPTPGAVSERVVLEHGLEQAAARAKALGGTLGAVIVDVANGAVAQVNGDRSLPMQRLQQLAIAAVTYRAIDDGRLPQNSANLVARMFAQGDESAANALVRANGGTDAIDGDLRNLGYDGIFIGEHEDGFGKPLSLSSLLVDLQAGKLLAPSSQKAMLAALSSTPAAPSRVRAGFPSETAVEELAASTTSGGMTVATNDAAIVRVRGRVLVIVAMLSGGKGSEAMRDAVLSDVGRTAYETTLAFPI